MPLPPAQARTARHAGAASITLTAEEVTSVVRSAIANAVLCVPHGPMVRAQIFLPRVQPVASGKQITNHFNGNPDQRPDPPQRRFHYRHRIGIFQTSMSDIITLLGSRIRDRSQIPESFQALTVPIGIEEFDLIQSIWFTLGCCSDVLVTFENHCVVFWRHPLPKVRSLNECCNGVRVAPCEARAKSQPS
jgi:hypothetical protein